MGRARSAVASIAGRRTVEVLAELGFWTCLVERDLPLEAAMLADLPIEADLDDWEQVEATLAEVHRRQPLRAVVSNRESLVPLAAFVAARLGVRGTALEGALNCRDKVRTRRVLEAYGVPSPGYRVVVAAGDARDAAHELGYPVVVKRTTGAGGAGVQLCASADEVQTAVEALTERVPTHPVLVEEYLDGPEFAVQALTLNGQTEILNVVRTRLGPLPLFREVGYDYPAGLPRDQEQALRRCVVDALEALGLDLGVSHSQVRLTATGPRLVEVNIRPPGGQLGHLTEVISGVDLVRASIEIAVGQPVTRRMPRARWAVYRCLVFDEGGRLSYAEHADGTDAPGLEGPVRPLVEVDVAPGDLVLPVTHPEGGAYGRVLVFGDNPSQVERDYRRILAWLDLRIEPLRGPEAAPSLGRASAVEG